MSDDQHRERLDSWKAIANYLGKSVRTARRWEAEEELPVHRQMHKAQGSVYAYAAEIDEWRRQREHRSAAPDTAFEVRSPPAASTTPAHSVVVLPFAYLGRDRASAYIGDGFTEEIITALSRLKPLRVISWTSSMTLRDSGKSAGTIGRELNVGQLVEGTVRHEGDRIRVTARLIDTSIDEPVWSHSYEGKLDELFAIQEHIAREVVDSMDLRLPASLGDRLSQQPAADVEAWQYLVRARHAALRWRKDAIDEAVALLHRGLAVAGEDARLYTALGRTHLHYREAGIDLGEAPLREAESNLYKASALEPELAAVHQLNGWLHYSRGEIGPAVAALKTALESEPADPDTLGLLANCYLISGRVAEARPLIDHILSIDPLTPLTRCMPGWADALEGNFDAAIRPYREMFEMDPDNPMARLFYVYVLASADRRREALEVAEATPAPILETPPGRVIATFAAAVAGREPITLADTDRQALAQATDVFPRFLAQAFALAGDTASAVDWIKVAVEKGFINYPFLARHDPFLAPLAGNPAYDRVLADARRRWEAFPA